MPGMPVTCTEKHNFLQAESVHALLV
jgi:hypothetical protein